MNHYNNNESIPAWRVVQERREEPFHFMVSRSSSNDQQSREAITSKRAAQNRAAQKAFRQRREQYIKELETKVETVEKARTEIDKVNEENTALKRRITILERQLATFTQSDMTQPLNDLLTDLTPSAWQSHSLDFDPFLDNSNWATNELLSNTNNEQVLDDLFNVLQTRQRPHISSLNEKS